MSELSPPTRVLIHAHRSQASLVHEVLEAARLDAQVTCGPEPEDGQILGDQFEAEPADDLRVALQRDDIDAILILSRDSLTAEERERIRERGLAAFSVEPRPSALADIVQPHESQIATLVPFFRFTVCARAMWDALESFGEVHAVHVAMRSPPHEGSLAARLCDALDVATRLLPAIESVDATLCDDTGHIPENLRHSDGTMAAHLRAESQAAGTLLVCNTSGVWFRGLTVTGPGGCMRCTDKRFEWIDGRGEVVDRSHCDDQAPTCGLAIGRQIRRHLDGIDTPLSAGALIDMLALSEAARLSARTRQHEHLPRVREILSKT